MIQFCDIARDVAEFKGEIDRRSAAVFEHTKFIMGPEVSELERRLSEFVGVSHCIACSNGTDALTLALLAAGVGPVPNPGDSTARTHEVVTVPFTWISTAEVISLIGAVPVFVDVREDTFLMDETKLEAAITPSTKAIIVVSLFGQMANMEAIMEIAARHKVIVIEDAAQSFGATRNGRKSCSIAHISTTSFFPSKPLGCYGDGGAVFTDSAELARKMQALHTHGANTRHEHWCIGFNARLDTLQAAILLAKCDRLQEIFDRRNAAGRAYDALLSSSGVHKYVDPPAVDEGNFHVYAQYTLRCHIPRDELSKALNAAGVQTAVYYPKCLHLQECFAHLGYRLGSFPVAERASAIVLSLPMHTFISSEDIQAVSARLRATILKATELVASRRSLVVVGGGYWGKNHVATAHSLGTLAAVCEAHEGTLMQYQTLEGVALLSSVTELVESADIRCAIIATPAHTHYTIAHQLLSAGKHVLVEKPLCLDAGEARALVDLAEAKGVILGVGHLLLYHPAFKALEELVQRGDIGEVKLIECQRKSMGKFRAEEDVMWSFSPHDVSMVLALAGQDSPAELQCMIKGGAACAQGDYAVLSLAFPNGVAATISASWVSPTKIHRTTVVGTRGIAVFDDCQPWSSKLIVYGQYSGGDSAHPTALPLATLEENSRRVSLLPEQPLTAEHVAFMQACATASPLRGSGREGLAVLSVLKRAEACAVRV